MAKSDTKSEQSARNGELHGAALFTLPPEDQREQIRHELAPLRAQLRRAAIQLRRTNQRLSELEKLHYSHTHDEGQPLRNGVHIDPMGGYWMQRPDGLHRMWVEDAPRLPVDPGRLQRLVEPKDRSRLWVSAVTVSR